MKAKELPFDFDKKIRTFSHTNKVKNDTNSSYILDLNYGKIPKRLQIAASFINFLLSQKIFDEFRVKRNYGYVCQSHA